MSVLDGKRVVLGVSGGIAAYKAASLASALMQEGALVEVVMTHAAQQFIQPLTFSAITHQSVHTDPFAPWTPDAAGHVSLADNADLVVVAPTTAATLARLAHGLADDLLSLVCLATRAPLLLAPAMEHHMFHHPATQANLTTLKHRGALIVGPESGRLASGSQGDGRLADPGHILAAILSVLSRSDALRGMKLVVTAGGTREPLDPVRYLGNRSSGRMGYAIAEAARDMGAEVVLISGPATIEPPDGVEFIRVETAVEMQSAVNAATVTANMLIMAAAVADFRAEAPSSQKIKKDPGTDSMVVRLVKNPDILAEIDRPGLIKIGFAAETDDLLENASTKLKRKNLAMIVANDASSTIGAEDSEAVMLFADGRTVALPRMSKRDLAREIVQATASLSGRADGPPS